MPTPLIKAYAKRSHRAKSRIERYWDEAKKSASEKFKGKKDEHYWAYVNAITKRRSGLQEMTFKEYLELSEDLGKPTVIKIEKGLTHKEALKACPWKPSYGDCRGFGYDPKTGEATWI